MTGLRNRIFAWVAVAIGVVAVLGLSVAAIIQQATTPSTTTPASTALACTDSNLESVIPAPAKYIPTGTVTALQITDLTTGMGKAAKSGDCLVAKYYGTLASDGTVFDQDYNTTAGFAFKLGQGQVIPGWDQGLVGMKVGGERRLVIPSSLAYGAQANGGIPANSALVFDVTLLRIQ